MRQTRQPMRFPAPYPIYSGRRLGDGDTCDPGTGMCFPSDPGSSSAQESDLRSKLFNIGSQLQQANQALVAHEQDIRALVLQTPGSVSPETAQDLLQLRKDFESMLDKYTTAYRAMFGTTPSGFSGLGSLGLEPVTLALIVTGIAAIGIALTIWWQHEANLGAAIEVEKQKAQTQGTMVNQADRLLQQAEAAQAQGNPALAAALRAQYNELLKTINNTNPNPKGGFPWTTAITVGGVVAVVWAIFGGD